MYSINLGRFSRKIFSRRIFLFTLISWYYKCTGLSNVYFCANLHLYMLVKWVPFWEADTTFISKVHVK